ncbi:MAG: diguanylate cyclase [Lachnospiraceae bacterium]|nr:diguanylate cyclase [Lachnospiraceae bacterium]
MSSYYTISEKKIKPWTSILVFFLSILIFSVLYFSVLAQDGKLVRERERYHAVGCATAIQEKLETITSRVQTLADSIIEKPDDTEFHKAMVISIWQRLHDEADIPLKNILLAPDGVVSYFYPTEGNESMTGFNFMDDTLPGNAPAIQACKTGQMLISEPFDMKQGGKGIAGRYPIFRKDGSLWGLISFSIEIDDLVHSLHLNDMLGDNVNYSLWYRNSAGEKTILTERGKADDPIDYDFPMKNLNWTLTLSLTQNRIDRMRIFTAIIMILMVSSMIALYVYEHSRMRLTNELLYELANKDSLTGCHSRRYLNTYVLNLENGKWRDDTKEYSLAIVDLDHFKQINDVGGHSNGDDILRTVAHLLASTVNADRGDAIIRFGGDEFILLYADRTPEEFRSGLEHVLEEVRKIKPEASPNIKVSLSGGGVHSSELTSRSYVEFFKVADQRLYIAKQRGRDRFIFDSEIRIIEK